MRLDIKEKKFPVKTRDIHKIEKKFPSALMFLVIKIQKNVQTMYQKFPVKTSMLVYYW